MKTSWFIYGGLVLIVLIIAGFILTKPPAQVSQANVSSLYGTSQTTPVAEVSHVVIRTKAGDNEVMTGPTMQLDKAKTYTAVLTTTEGPITIALNATETPITVNNFVTLAKKDFYNNTIFHRVIDGFMIQGGDPTGTGSGGPGYKFADEPFTGDYTRGTVAMANSGPNTNGSQFFIMHKDYNLPKNYVIFGKVTDGMDVVDKIATAPVEAGGEGSSPVNPVKITSVAISEN